MSQSEEEETNSEDQDRENEIIEEVTEGEEGSAPEEEVRSEEVQEEEKVEEPEVQQPALDPGLTSDPRFSRLMKMRSQYVTEEALRSTEEKSRPPAPAPPPEGEFHDEEFYDEDYPEEELYDEEFDEFEDDEYEDPELVRPAAEQTPKEEPVPEPDPEPEDEEEVDHRVARLRKLRKTFVTEKDLEIKDTGKEHEVYKETKVQLVVCPNCQAEEPRYQKMCGQCGAKLPNITAVEDEKYNPGTLNKAVLKYFDAVKKLKEETWTIDEFIEFMNERYDLSKNHIDGLLELIEECGSEEWLPEATKLIMQSTLLLEDAIVAMIEKVEEVRAEHLEFEPEVDEDGDPLEAPLTLEERVLAIDFQPELNDIKNANSMMLNTLKLIDEFQKQAQADLEVSM